MAAIRTYYEELFDIAAKNGFWLRILGAVSGHKIWLIRTRDYYVPDYEHTDPRLLIVAGFHGEEVAGPLAILKWLKTHDENVWKKIDLSFIPIVNPYGFAKGTRYGESGKKTNAGFCHTKELEGEPSPEGQILIDSISIIRPLAQDGFLSLHEDKSERGYYLYTFEHGPEPGKFTQGLKREIGKHFHRPVDGIRVFTDAQKEYGPMVKDGLIYRLCDGTFEDWLFHLGVPRCAVTETPGKYRLARRVEAGVAIIDKFIQLCEELK